MERLESTWPTSKRKPVGLKAESTMWSCARTGISTWSLEHPGIDLDYRGKAEEGTTLTIAGFAYPNDHMMEMVSNAGNGTYKVVTDLDDAIDYAYSDLIDGMYFIAKDVKIQVEFNPDFIYAHRKLGYENRELEDWMFFEATIDAGEIPLGHAVTAIYEVIPVGQSLPEPEGAPRPDDGCD